MRTHFEIYQDESGDYRWRAKRAGRIVADSSEGYSNRADLDETLRNFLQSIEDDDLELPDDFTR